MPRPKLLELYRASNKNVTPPRVVTIRHDQGDTSRYNIDTPPSRYNLAGRLYDLELRGDTSNLNLDVVPTKYYG